MNVVAWLIEIHLAEARSLKEKRMLLRSLKARLRTRFNVAVAEVGHQDLWQRATLAVVAVAGDREPLERTFEDVRSEVERHLPGEILDIRAEYLV